MQQSTRTTRSSGFRWNIIPSEAAGYESLIQDHADEMHEQLKALDPDDRTWFRIPDDDSDGLFVKVFRHDSMLQRSRYTVFGSQAGWEWKHLLHLHDRNVPVPPPVALGQRTSSGLLNACVLVTKHLGGSLLRNVLHERYGTDGWASFRTALWESLAQVTARQIEEGFYHQDYHDQNLVVVPGSGTTEVRDPTVYSTDLHRARQYASLTTSQISKMLAFLIYSLRTVVPLWECQRFFRTLKQKQSVNASFPDWSTVLNDLQARRRNHRVRRTTDCFDDNEKFTMSTPANGWSAHHDASVSPEDIHGWIRDAEEDDTTPSVRVLKERSDGRVLHLTSDDLIIEETTGALVRRKIQRLVGQSKSRKSWKNVHAMAVRDLPVPDGVALVEPTNSFSQRPSYFIRTFEEGRRLDRLMETLDAGPSVDVPVKKSTLLREAVDFVGMLHTEGVFHKDMKAGNVLVTSYEPDVAFLLIDLDRVSFYDRPLPEKPRIKNLVQLNASMTQWLTRTDRREAWNRYTNRPDVPFSDAEEARKQIVERSRRRLE